MRDQQQLLLIGELRGKTCRCGKRKASGETFCRDCYFRLPPRMRQALYRGLGNGYEEAYTAAVDCLAGKVAS
jgi:hypothetical protein